ncbi:hypothetical protein [Lysinibacillus mangiferihumi]|uniref:hypothetical protein n=1 Tax=Lysinibacillus mangiferihumi TaxID=1130819 RepID=UPI00142E5E71|nr:hypothetical protein [Lysinibacillus mangiferihumi]
MYGEIADGLNAVIYYARGDKVNAALSLGAMIPFAGMASAGAKFINKGAKAFNGVVDGIKTVTNKGPIGQLKEKATKQLDTVKDKFQTKVAEVKDQFRQLGTPQLELAGVKVGRITDTGTVGKNKPTPNPKPSNSSKPPEKDSKPAEGTKGTGEGSKKISDVPHVKEARDIIAERTKGLDLNQHPTTTKQMSYKKMKALRDKIDNRTITKQEYAD